MSKALIKETLRSISRTKNRFISIIAIVALGISFFVGVNVTGTVMRNTADKYFNDAGLMDICIISNLGLTDKDITKIKQVDGVADVMPGKYLDATVEIDGNGLVDVNGSQFTMRARSIDILSIALAENGQGTDGYLNRPSLTEGRWPQKSGECVLDSFVKAKSDDFKIGTTFKLVTKDSDIKESLETDTYTVVGFVDSPYYVSSYEKDQAPSGRMSAFIYIPDTDMLFDYYTEIFVKAKNEDDFQTFSDEYTEYIEELKSKIESVSAECLQTRVNEIKPELKKQIAEGEKKLAEEEPKALAEIEKAKSELEELRKKYISCDADLANQQAELNKKKEEGEAKLKAGEQEHSSGLAQWQAKKNEYDAGYKEWQTQKAKYDAGQIELNAAKVQMDQYKQQLDFYAGLLNAAQLAEEILDASENGTLEENIDQYITEAEIMGNDDLADLLGVLKEASSDATVKIAMASLKALLNANKEGIDQKREELAAAQAQYNEGEKVYNQKLADMEVYDKQLTEAKAELDSAKIALDEAEAQLDQGELEIVQGRDTLESEIAKYQKMIDDGKVEIEKFKSEFPDIEKKYLDGINKGENELKNAKSKLQSAKTLLKNTDNPQWYITDRNGVPGYENFAGSADQIETIAKVFPVFFFLVAVLVCLTTMTRMVEEERTQLGTLKALGYSEKEIAGKYVLYAFLASAIGSAIGFIIGFTVFPIAIFAAYRIMYSMPKTELTFSFLYAALGFMIASALTILAALIVCIKDLKIVPAQLMRPKAPKAGKRVFLEKIPFTWKRLNFTAKVTVRNLLRNKKRFFMTIFGVAGCSALLLTGLGLSDSVNAIVGKQYDGGISKYDFQILLSDEQEYVEGKQNLVLEEIKTAEKSRIDDGMLTYFNSVQFGKSGSEKMENNKDLTEIYLVVPEKKEALSKFVTLRNRTTKKEYNLDDNGVLITEKVAQTLNISIGDTVFITRDNGETTAEVPVSGILENYCMSYMYMSPQLYNETFKDTLYFNYIFGTLTDEVREEAKNAKGDEITEQGKLTENLMNNNNVMAVVFTTQFVETFQQVVTSLNLVVVIFVVGAIALALVVLNNLTNVNISERIREIATIKVLGFYDKEVSAYVYRENIVLSIFGIILGLVGGIFLHKFVVSASEVEGIMFGREISALSFILTIVITALITVAVNVMTHFTLKKVDMVESMKSIE